MYISVGNDSQILLTDEIRDAFKFCEREWQDIRHRWLHLGFMLVFFEYGKKREWTVYWHPDDGIQVGKWGKDYYAHRIIRVGH